MTFFPFFDTVPNQEQFDAMNDCAFCDWWDEFDARCADQWMTDAQREAQAQARADAETGRGW